MVGVLLAVGLNNGVGVLVGVFEGVGVLLGVDVAVCDWVGVLAIQVDGGAVTSMDTLTITVRELSPVILIGFKGTRGTMGEKNVST